ncbi:MULTISPECIES: glycoside hydrolase family 18 protein [unclassified Actinoplanes]|uniref:glycoside hydrolase family 18 protein n=1 Tax=unclassified Actinoplanes TaxID=2626549 RepID=UPI0012FCDF0A|nr:MULTISPECIES: glycosyl hydrolase family 18 protein [unclassified Actinoplanes]
MRTRACRPSPVVLAVAALQVAAATLALPIATPAAAQAAAPYRKVGYFSRAAVKPKAEGGADFQIRDLDEKGSAAKLTSLHYAFGSISAAGECQITSDEARLDYQQEYPATDSLDGVADQPGQALRGVFNQIRRLKAKYSLRTSISLGGGSGSANFAEAARTAVSREKFVRSCIDLYIKGDLPQLGGQPQGGIGAGAGVFDGIDIDWEYPGATGNSLEKHNYTLLLQEFRRQLDAYRQGAEGRPYYLLTAALPGGAYTLGRGYELPAIFTYLDWAVLMAYDMHGAWESPSTTNHQSALHLNAADPDPTDRSVDIYLKNLTDHGVAPGRLVLGVPFYSRGWTGVDATDNGLFRPGTGVSDGRDYRTVKEYVHNGFVRHWDDTAKAAWLFNGNTFWTFDDPAVMTEKAGYAKAAKLGGIGVWALNQDDDQGALLAAIDSGLR